MNRPICLPCRVQMTCRKTGVDVELMASDEPYQIWSADLFECPVCRYQVVSGFGNAPVAEHFQNSRYEKFLPGVLTRFWATLQELKESKCQ